MNYKRNGTGTGILLWPDKTCPESTGTGTNQCIIKCTVPEVHTKNKQKMIPTSTGTGTY
jgi:hypothetical protein